VPSGTINSTALVMQLSLQQRFFKYVDMTPVCWKWNGSLNNRGYGRLGIGKHKTLLAHRISYELFVGSIPEGMELHHKCGVPNCVNPSHLEISIHRTHMVVLHDKNAAAINSRRTHCPSGHEYTPENTYRYKKGERMCRTCNRFRYHKRKSLGEKTIQLTLMKEN
jgi:hypothetical protein